ncbi:hypothetical protein EBB07_33695 [Paenibacillaceae bacterium]|nr:hypothetical protein EBB07_33695 [Paenibacillaceae bacterium]
MTISDNVKMNILEEGTVVYVDTRDRYLEFYAVSVTQMKQGKLVLRHAMRYPTMPKTADYYIIDATGYSAASSAGYVTVFPSFEKYDHFACEIVGELTLKRSLEPVAPRKVHVIKRREGSFPDWLETHGNSNCSTAAAAFRAIESIFESVSVRTIKDPICVVSGQSDDTDALIFEGERLMPVSLEIEEEHQTEIINPLTVAVAAAEEKLYLSFRGSNLYKEDMHSVVYNRALAVLIGESDQWSAEIAKELIKKAKRRGGKYEMDRLENYCRSTAELTIDSIEKLAVIAEKWLSEQPKEEE